MKQVRVWIYSVLPCYLLHPMASLYGKCQVFASHVQVQTALSSLGLGLHGHPREVAAVYCNFTICVISQQLVCVVLACHSKRFLTKRKGAQKDITCNPALSIALVRGKVCLHLCVVWHICYCETPLWGEMSVRRILGRDFSQIVFYIVFLLKYFSTWIKDIELFSYCKKTRNVFNIILNEK